MKNKYHIFFTGMLSIAFFMGATVDTKAQDSIAVVSRVNIEHLKAMPDIATLQYIARASGRFDCYS